MYHTRSLIDPIVLKTKGKAFDLFPNKTSKKIVFSEQEI